MGFWNSASVDAIYSAVKNRHDQSVIDREGEYVKYADYYDGRKAVIEPYFTRRARETLERFKDRPKESWPLCRPIVDMHAESLTKGFTLEFEDEATQAAWAEIAERNEFNTTFASKVGTTVGKYGWCVTRPVLAYDDDGELVMEFDSNTPLETSLIFDTGAGRSIPRIQGVAFCTGYSIENGDIYSWPGVDTKKRQLYEKRGIQERVEVITADRWLVWLDGRQVTESPFGDPWAPSDDGSNPYGYVPASLVNGLESDDEMLGSSDLHHPVYDVQQVNELWSDMVYASRMLVPIPTLKTDDKNIAANFSAGLGTGMVVSTDGDFFFATPNVDFERMSEVFLISLQLALADAKAPAVTLGLESLVQSGGTLNGPSGDAKEMDWRPVISHAMAKRRPFTRGMKDLARKAMRMAADERVATVTMRDGGTKSLQLGIGARGIKWDAPIKVDYSDEIAPVSQMEKIQLLTSEMLAGVTSLRDGMKRYHGYTDEQADDELAEMDAEKKARMANMMPVDNVDDEDEKGDE